jgi:hypothetical protein
MGMRYSKAGVIVMLMPRRLWGNPAHLKFLNDSLRERFAQDNLHVLVPKSNAGNFTYDGIELGGERVTSEIEKELEELSKNGTAIDRISVIGYSLGGLIARYAIGLLYHKGIFERIQPIVCLFYSQTCVLRLANQSRISPHLLLPISVSGRLSPVRLITYGISSAREHFPKVENSCIR